MGERGRSSLVPEPRSMEERPGSLALGAGATVSGPPELAGAAELAALWLSEAMELRAAAAAGEPAPWPRDPASPGRRSSRPAPVRMDAAARGTIRFVLDPSIREPEGYRLSIAQDGATAAAGSAEGAVRAASTLRQLALSGGDLPCLEIEDAPRFAWRGAMLDCARNFFTVDFLERFLDLCSLHKLNRFHWHLTDDQAWRIEISSRPELAARGSRRADRRHAYPVWKGGSYSRADAERVVAYARERGIVVVPEIDVPGHATALLASHPELSCAGGAERGLPFEPEDRFGIFPDILCAGNDRALDLLGEVFDELAEIFPGPYFHAGGDEAPKERWLSCHRCRGRMKAEGLRDEGGALDPELLQGWFMDRVARILAARGKRMAGWDEILDGRVGRDAIIMSWRGRAGGIAAAKAGYDAVMCPQDHACYLDHKHLDSAEEPGNIGFCTVRESYEFEPVPPELSEGEARRIIGAQANIWSEMLYSSRQVEYMAYPRLAALAEAFWTARDRRDFSSFAERLGEHKKRLSLFGVSFYPGPLE